MAPLSSERISSLRTVCLRFSIVVWEKHRVRAGEPGFADRELVDQTTPDNSLPNRVRFITRANCDYADIFLTFSNLFDATDIGTAQLVYIRLRARKKGEVSWEDIGTLPYVGQGSGSVLSSDQDALLGLSGRDPECDSYGECVHIASV